MYCKGDYPINVHGIINYSRLLIEKRREKSTKCAICRKNSATLPLIYDVAPNLSTPLARDTLGHHVTSPVTKGGRYCIL